MALYQKNKPETIQAMFGSIATQYDRTNAILSFQLHKRWNSQLVNTIMRSYDFSAGADLCCGTGEIAFTYLRKASHPCTLYMIDFCSEMLTCAQEKAKKLKLNDHKLTYIQADVQEIPLGNESIDYATIAYGIRNVQDPAKCFNEVYRVLKHKGRIGILELTEPRNPLIRFGHRLYLRTFVPILGKLLTSNQEAYNYLCRSIQGFIKPQELALLLFDSGFRNIEIKPLHGGIATIISADKED